VIVGRPFRKRERRGALSTSRAALSICRQLLPDSVASPSLSGLPVTSEPAHPVSLTPRRALRPPSSRASRGGRRAFRSRSLMSLAAICSRHRRGDRVDAVANAFHRPVILSPCAAPRSSPVRSTRWPRSASFPSPILPPIGRGAAPTCRAATSDQRRARFDRHVPALMKKPDRRDEQRRRPRCRPPLRPPSHSGPGAAPAAVTAVV